MPRLPPFDFLPLLPFAFLSLVVSFALVAGLSFGLTGWATCFSAIESAPAATALLTVDTSEMAEKLSVMELLLDSVLDFIEAANAGTRVPLPRAKALGCAGLDSGRARRGRGEEHRAE